ncbi:MAG: hypothetical protein ACI9UV_000056 [Algoriphagus sp.]|jgi:hypothetical protein
MKKLSSTSSLLLGLLLVITSCSSAKKIKAENNISGLSDKEIIDIAIKAYVYGYPLILMDLTRKVSTNVEAPGIKKSSAPINQFGHYHEFPDHKLTDVVKPNVDTYYSTVFFDLSKEAFVLSVPATERYYLLPMLDAYTNVFASLGTRTTGTASQDFLITEPFWEGEVPEGMTHIKSPTSLIWLLGRTQVNSKEDGATVVRAIQDGYKLVPLNYFGQEYTAPKGVVNEDYKSIVPVKDIKAMSISTFFSELAALMVNNAPLEGDDAIINDMAKIGIVAGKPFSMDGLRSVLKAKLGAIPNAVDKNFRSIVASQDPSTLINGWGKAYQMPNVGNYGTDYNFRALVAYVGLGANLPQDAVYPNTALDAKGDLFDSESKYVVHFEKDQIPPTKAFWSLTIYNDQNFLSENSINRFALGDRDDLTYNADGSLDIYVQRENPGKAKYSNWLPAPAKGNFELTLRLYWPKEEVFNKTWVPVPVQKVQ